jgi:hypothetical protein
MPPTYPDGHPVLPAPHPRAARIRGWSLEALEFQSYSSHLMADGLEAGAPDLAAWYRGEALACEAEMARQRKA